MKDQEFVEWLIKSIVAHPQEVRTERSVDDMGVLIQLHVHREDMGVVVGRRGVTSNAIKLLTKLAGFNNGVRVSLKICEPD